MTHTITLALTLLVLAGCGRQPSQPTTSTGSAAAPAQPDTTPPVSTADGATMSVSGVSFTVPLGWNQALPSNSMRLAEVHAPGETEPCVAAFSMAGGGIEANIARWATQMTDDSGAPIQAPEVNTRQINGLTVHTVELRGTYLGMRRSPPQPDTILRGAIIETASGHLFIKMTGSAAAMSSLADAWNALIESTRTG